MPAHVGINVEKLALAAIDIQHAMDRIDYVRSNTPVGEATDAMWAHLVAARGDVLQLAFELSERSA
jgi:hypothetical protein